eukprot:Gb_35694 [translate_table: standard]
MEGAEEMAVEMCLQFGDQEHLDSKRIVSVLTQDESQNSRLQSRKGGFSSRNRRNQRSSEDDLHQHQGRSNEMDESLEDTEIAGSEEEDDLPPPRISRRSGKLKIHLKACEDATAIDMAVVPRKLRTAMMKRHHNSTPPINAGSLRKSSNMEVVATSPSTRSKIAFKPGRRIKPNKPRSAKTQKISLSTISEQEAEVAETLYDLARMFSSQILPSIPAEKSEPNSGMRSCPATAVSPHSPATAVASSPSLTHTSASKRKRPCVNSKDAGQATGGSQATITANPCLSICSLGVVPESVDAEPVALSFDKSSFETETLVLSMPALKTGSPSMSTEVSHSLSPIQMPQTVDNAAISEDKVLGKEFSNHASSMNVTGNIFLVETKAYVANPSDMAEKDSGVRESSVAREALTKLEFGNRQILSHAYHCKCVRFPEGNIESMFLFNKLIFTVYRQLSPTKSDSPCKVEIDFMPPSKSGDRTNDTSDFNKVDVKDEKELDLATIPAAGNSMNGKEGCEDQDKTKNMEILEEDKQICEKMEHDLCNDWEAGKKIEQLEVTNNQNDYSKERAKQEMLKQTPRGMSTNVKADSKVQKVDRSGMFGSASVAAITGTSLNSVQSMTLPISMGLAAWPGGLPLLGYYSPAAAAAWPAPVSMMETSSVDENNTTPPQLPLLFLQSKQSWKRSATHVHITHFIYSRQQMKKNPLWATAYGSATCLYGAKAYNLNSPMACADATFGNTAGSSLGGVPVSSSLGPAIRSPVLGVGSINGKGFGVAAVSPANGLGTKDKSSNLTIEAFGRKPPLQHQTHMTQQQLTSSSQAGPAFVKSASSTTGNDAAEGNVGVSESILGGGSSASFNRSSVGVAPVDVGSGSSNGSIANAAAVQAQLLHSVIQRSTFPYLFPHGHFGPLFSGHLSPQQLAQDYKNTFGPPSVHPPPHAHQSQLGSDLTSEASVSKREQQQPHSQGVCSFVSSGSPQQQQENQGALGTPGDASPHQECINKKENITVESVSTTEMKPSVQRNVYGHNSPLQILNVNSPPSILAAGMPAMQVQPQELSTMAAFVGKQASKNNQQAQTRSQSLHQSTSNMQLQQQHVATQNHMSSPAMQISLKGDDLHTSQPLSGTSIGLNKGSDTSLELPIVTSVMASQGHSVLHSMVDTVSGLGQFQISPYNHLVSGQTHQLSMLANQQQKQQWHVQTHRAISTGIEDRKMELEEGSYSSSLCMEDKNSRCKQPLNQSSISRADLEASPNIHGSPTKDMSSLTGNASSHINMMVPSSQDGTSNYCTVSIPTKQSNQSFKQQIVNYKFASSSNISLAPALVESSVVTFSDRIPPHPAASFKMPPIQGFNFPGHVVTPANQGVKQGGGPKQQVKKSQRSLAGSPMPSPQAMVVAMTKSQGHQSKSHQSAMKVAPISRLTPASSISSPCMTPLLPLSPVSKPGGDSENALSVNDSYSLPPKSSLAASSVKKTTSAITPNAVSVLASSPPAQNVPSKLPHMHLIQNQYNIQQQQHMSYPLFQQTLQPMVSAQQQHQSEVQQQYPLHHSPSNQHQALQLQKQSATQQQQLQFRHQILEQQNPQYVQTQSQIHVPSHQTAMHLQQSTKQMKQQSGQWSSPSQQLGNTQHHHLEQQQHQQLQPVSPTTFGIPVNGASFPTLSSGTGNAGTVGNVPQSTIYDGAVISESTALRPSTPAKLTMDTNMASSCFLRGNTAGPAFVLSQYGPSNSTTSSQQQIRNSSTVSLPCPNSASHTITNSDTSGKLGNDKPMEGN